MPGPTKRPAFKNTLPYDKCTAVRVFGNSITNYAVTEVFAMSGGSGDMNTDPTPEQETHYRRVQEMRLSVPEVQRRLHELRILVKEMPNLVGLCGAGPMATALGSWDNDLACAEELDDLQNAAIKFAYEFNRLADAALVRLKESS